MEISHKRSLPSPAARTPKRAKLTNARPSSTARTEFDIPQQQKEQQPPPWRQKRDFFASEELNEFLKNVQRQLQNKQIKGFKFDRHSSGTPPDCIASDPKAKVSLVLHLFQAGFSINDSNICFHKYTPENLLFLNSIDRGYIPCFFTDINSRKEQSGTLKYYKGCLVCEIHDYRMLVRADTRPSVHRVLLRPHTETVISQARTLSRQRGAQADEELSVEKHVLLKLHPKVSCIVVDGL
jgi:hypothetical protein